MNPTLRRAAAGLCSTVAVLGWAAGAGQAAAQGVAPPHPAASAARPQLMPTPTTPTLNSITSTVPNTGTQTDPSGTTVPPITPAPPNRG